MCQTNVKGFHHSFYKRLVCILLVLSVICPVTASGPASPFTITASAADYTYTYYACYTGNSNSLVDALKAVGADSSFASRKPMAALNGYPYYSGSAAENRALLAKLKSGTLIKSKVEVSSSNWEISTQSSIEVEEGQSTTVDIQFKGSGISSYGGTYTNSSVVGVYFTTPVWKPAGQWCSVKLVVTGKAAGTSTITFKLNGTKALNKSINVTVLGRSSTDGIVTNNNYNVEVSNRAKETTPHYTNAAGKRSAHALNTVIDQFNVTTNRRYWVDSYTYCNIFAWDCTRALEAEIPHWVKNNQPATSNTSGASELNANATYNWLNNYGSTYGWRKVTASQAQQRANSGYPTVAIWKNTSRGSGHIAVVRPEGNEFAYSSSKGPVIAQAGGTNLNYGNVSTGFGASKIGSIVYWTHD